LDAFLFFGKFLDRLVATPFFLKNLQNQLNKRLGGSPTNPGGGYFQPLPHPTRLFFIVNMHKNQ